VLFARIAAVTVGFPLLSFLCGWAVVGRLPGLDRAQRFTVAWGAGYAILAASQFLAFITHAPQPWFQVGVLVAALAACFSVGRFFKPSFSEFWPLVGWALAYAHLLCIQALLPLYVGSDWWGDWHMHYQEAQVFVGHLSADTHWTGAGTYTIASRTPLFNLAAAFPLALAGDEFWVFQVAASALNCCFVPAVYLVLRDLFDLRAARLGMLLASLNLWLLHNAWFTWPKMLTAYYLVLALHFYLQWLRRQKAGWCLGCWLHGLLGFLTHQVAAVYLGVLMLHAVVVCVRRPALRPRLRYLVLLPITALLLVGPWYGWLVAYFGLHDTLHSTPVTQMEERPALALIYIGSVVFNLAASVLPLDLGQTLKDGPRTFEAIYHGLTSLYFSLLPGALTVSLSVFLLGALVQSQRSLTLRGRLAPLRQPEWSATWAFLLLGALGAAALHPRTYTHGIAHAALFPSVLVLLALAWGLLSRAPRGWAVLTVGGMILEFAALFWSHVYLTTWPRFLDPTPYNWGLKTKYQLVFLADCFAPMQPVVIGLTLAVELVLVFLLLRCLGERLQNDRDRV
jgi:hypothetical protein